MSDRTRLKHGTKHIQKYLVKASIESTGHLSWIKKCRTDPDTPTNHMKISVFLRCGEIIANDLPQVALIPNSVIHHLRDVILLRDTEIALRAPWLNPIRRSRRTATGTLHSMLSLKTFFAC